MAVLPGTVHRGLGMFVFDARRTIVVSRLVALNIILVGVAGAALLPSSQVSATGFVVVASCAASTVVAGLFWLVVPWSGRFDRAFVIYADVGIGLVLLCFQTTFPAFAGVGLFILVSLYVLLFGDRSTLIAHTLATLALTGYMAAAAVRQGTDPWVVASQAVCLVSASIGPVLFYLFNANLNRQFDRVQHDPETGLYNRAGLDLAVAAACIAQPSTSALVAMSVAFDDIDVQISGREDHHPVRRDLSAIVKTLHDLLPADAVLARTATTEFVGCALVSDRDAGSALIVNLRTGLRTDQFPRDGLGVGFTVVGFSNADCGPSAAGWTVQRAIAAAQLRRNDRIAQLAHSTQPPTTPAGEAVARLKEVLRTGGPAIVFQPICRADNGMTVGFEALSRFPTSGGDTATWFADAADTGLGAELERAAIDRALKESSSLPRNTFLSLNLSAETLLIDIHLPDLLIEASHHRPLVVEITEHADIEEHDAVRTILSSLRRGGVKIAVDDVGAGYAGLRQLVLLEPDIVKLDAFVVHDMGQDPTRLAAAEFILEFARKTGARCVFEGIETDADLEAAKLINADLLQGYRIAHPAPVNEFTSQH